MEGFHTKIIHIHPVLRIGFFHLPNLFHNFSQKVQEWSLLGWL